jgi:hypothetical protein
MIRKLMLLSLLAASTTEAQETADEQQVPQIVDQPSLSESAQQTFQDDERSTPEEQNSGGVKTLSGISILGNEEAPKSLVIVPWKSSELGDEIGATNSTDELARPVDKEVFMREVHYYELRSGG